jgi:dipeptidase D
MEGIFHLDVSDLSARTLINVDSTEEGVFTVGCAGGALARLDFPYSREEQALNTPKLRLYVHGLTGGHSGVDIQLGRLNANMAMGRILYAMSRSMDIRLIDIKGGEKDNTIPRFCEALIAVPESEETAVAGTDPSVVKAPAAVRAAALAQDIFATIKDEYSMVEPDMELDVVQEYGEGPAPMTSTSGTDILCALMVLPDGVQRMSPDIENMVQTSLNLGILSTHEDKVRFEYCVRSTATTEKMNLIERLRILTERLSGTLEVLWNFPEWNYTSYSRIREIMADVYRRSSGKEPLIHVSQGGLECGVFSRKIPGIDVISIGPNMFDIHTPSERADIESIRRTYDLLLNTLKELV